MIQWRYQMSKETTSFEFPCGHIAMGRKDLPRQIHGVETLRHLFYLQNAVSEIQDRIERIDKALEDLYLNGPGEPVEETNTEE